MSLLLAGAAMLPAACSQQEPAAEPTEAAAPEAPSGIAVTEGRLVLPPVGGNPGAIYFTIVNGGDADVQIAAANVTGAGMAMLHTTRTEGGTTSMAHLTQVPVAAGETVSFAPGGMHVMVSDLGPGLTVGSQAEVTLTFADGDKVSFPAEVRAAGDAT
ncbi:copper chaperone PCu(A)C [Croceibacterium sp. TMG7-5b_MA50]|uniref:copper chaperone PCu(A)C n=1 Tax=Croceibacterium sp. TMG7-5b_MA50 TaxID=3121290 RepID=UPI0032215732